MRFETILRFLQTTPLTLRNLPELGFGVRPFVAVGVVLERKLVEGLLDLPLGGISGHAEDVVVVPLGEDELGDEQHEHCKQQHRLRRGHVCCFSPPSLLTPLLAAVRTAV